MRFADTNVLLYAISTGPKELAKVERANELLADRDLGLSVQVLQEFYVQATRPSRHGATPHQDAVDHSDAAIIEAARSLGCDTVLSEDLSDGQDYDGARVEDTFRGATWAGARLIAPSPGTGARLRLSIVQ